MESDSSVTIRKHPHLVGLGGGLAAIYTQTGNSMVQNLKEPSRYVGVQILVSSPEPVCKSESGVLQQRRNEFSGSTSGN